MALLGTFEHDLSLGGLELGSGGGSDIFQIELNPSWTVAFGRRFGEGCSELDPAMALAGDAVALVVNTLGSHRLRHGPVLIRRPRRLRCALPLSRRRCLRPHIQLIVIEPLPVFMPGMVMPFITPPV